MDPTGLYRDFDSLSLASAAAAAASSTQSSCFSELRGLLNEFKVISSLQEGERLHRTESGITDKYPKPTNPVYSVCQAAWRNRMAQNTESDLLAVRSLTQKTTRCLQELSILELIAGYDEKMNLLYKLKKHVEKCVTTSFPHFSQTCATGASNLLSVKEQACQMRGQLASEVLTELKTLSSSVNDRIHKLEELNLATDINHCERFFEIFTSSDPISTLKNRYPSGGLPTTVCSNAARTVLKDLFTENLVNRVFNLYHLEHKGRLRMQDLQSLIIGTVAHYSLADIPEHLPKILQLLPGFPTGREEFQDNDLTRLLTVLRKVALTNITPDACYKALLEQDIAFLRAHATSEQYKEENQHIHLANRFRHLEHEILDVLQAFTKTPSCIPQDGALYYNYDHKKMPRCWEAFPVIAENELSAVAVVPATKSSKPVIRFLLHDKDVRVTKEAFQQHIKHLGDRRFTLEIVGKSGSYSQAIFSLLELINENTNIDKVNFYFFGQARVSKQVLERFLEVVTDRRAIQFSVRYFLQHGSTFEATQDAYLGSGAKPQNLALTLLYFAREQKYIDQTPIAERWFSHFDERQRDNLTYIADVKTTSSDDCQIYYGFQNQKQTRQTSYEEINQVLSPIAPPKSGWFG